MYIRLKTKNYKTINVLCTSCGMCYYPTHMHKGYSDQLCPSVVVVCAHKMPVFLISLLVLNTFKLCETLKKPALYVLLLAKSTLPTFKILCFELAFMGMPMMTHRHLATCSTMI